MRPQPRAISASLAENAHFETSPDHYEMTAPCSSWTSIPKSGTCRGVARNTGPETITGDWKGQSEYTYGFFILPSGFSYGGGVDRFTGTINGCGTGSVIYQEQYSSDAKGNFKGSWQMVEASGTGDLASLRGSGTYSGVTKPDGSISGEYGGRVDCTK
jgi:Protein of unknown function (DUF3224)